MSANPIPFYDEIIRHPAGNTYVGSIANKFCCCGPLTIPDLPVGPFHVIEVVGKEIIHRASQSTRELALAYIGENRILIS